MSPPTPAISEHYLQKPMRLLLWVLSWGDTEPEAIVEPQGQIGKQYSPQTNVLLTSQK